MQNTTTTNLSELVRRVQRIEIVARRSVDHLFAGEFRSAFRGQGIEFDEVRPYQPGDDVRSIDWNVTARAGDCFVKRFREERQLTVLFVVDVSASGLFGTWRPSKLEIATEIAAVLMFSALKNNDRVGLLTFANEVVDYVPPRAGRSQVWRLIRRLVEIRPPAGETDLAKPLEFLQRVQRRRAVVFLLSDFLADFPQRILGSFHQRHDVTAITIQDRRERQLTDVGLVRLRDPETGQVMEVDTGHPAVRTEFARQAELRQSLLSNQWRKVGIPQLVVDSHADYVHTLRRFFADKGRLRSEHNLSSH